MAKHDDPKLALRLAKQYLVRENPPREDSLDEAQERVSELCMELASKGVNVSSLSEAQWIEQLEAMGLEADQISVLIEDIAQWGITDVPDEVL